VSLDASGWRSLHFVPGGNDKMLAKAPTLPADALILDLEDAVAPEGKTAARAKVVAWLGAHPAERSAAARLVRVNPAATPWASDDLAAVVPAAPDALVIPKVEAAAEVEALDARLSELETQHRLAPGAILLVLIATETARGLLRVEELARAPRVAAITWGAEDLSAALGGIRNRDDDGRFLELYRYARWQTRLAAAAADIPAIDGVFVDIRDRAGLERESREAADVGFCGKLTIHPDQIAPVNAAFTPSGEAVETCRAMLEEYEAQRRDGSGAFLFRGEMVDAPHLARARSLLERAQKWER
jgi:citrate lyase subunit beta/citryl-CoA lyase